MNSVIPSRSRSARMCSSNSTRNVGLTPAIARRATGSAAPPSAPDEIEQLAFDRRRAFRQARPHVPRAARARGAPLHASSPPARAGEHWVEAIHRAVRRRAAEPRASRFRAPSSALGRAASGTCAQVLLGDAGAAYGGRFACRRGARDRTAARRKPEMQLKSVDLPAPLGPMSPVIEPASTSRLAPSTARTPSNARTTSRTCRLALTRAHLFALAQDPLRPQQYEPDDHGRGSRSVARRRGPRRSGTRAARSRGSVCRRRGTRRRRLRPVPPHATEPAEDHDHPREERQKAAGSRPG